MDLFPLNQRHQCLGVINITPNSFSDGGVFNNQDSFEAQFLKLYSLGVRYFDIGAESTAPSSRKINYNEEWERFEKIALPFLEQYPLDDITISIDTYKSDLFYKMYRTLRALSKRVRLIWNDVSGVIDSQTLEYLELLKKDSKLFYVLSHTEVTEKEKTSFHMDYLLKCSEDNLENYLQKYFKESLKRINSSLWNQIILDPCFGFSKSRQQNKYLLNNISKVFSGDLKGFKLLLGVSRKSFFQTELHQENSKDQKIFYAEIMHSLVLSNWFKELKGREVLYRLHDPNIFKIVKDFL